jgi:hypothetical protein
MRLMRCWRLCPVARVGRIDSREWRESILDTVLDCFYSFKMASNATSSPVTTTWRRRAVWWAVALVVIILGFADLARGGETLAPVLLVIGYCVLVPIAILQ